MSNPFISIVVCTYNRDKFILDCLDGFVKQDSSKDEFEVLLVDNNSTDQTSALIHKFMEEHPDEPFHYFLELQQGNTHARNRGIKEAKGEIVTFIDDDAIPHPDFVRRIATFFNGHPDAVAAGGKVLAIFESERPAWANRFSESLYFSHYDQGDRPFRYKKGYPIGCNMSFRQSFFKNYVQFDPTVGRIGKGGEGFDEKDVFTVIRNEGLPYYYDPTQKVYHQIDDDRLSVPFQERLALGLGYSNHRMFCKGGTTWTCFTTTLSILFKYAASYVLALGYLLIGRPVVSRHLIRFRYLVAKGFFERLGS